LNEAIIFVTSFVTVQRSAVSNKYVFVFCSCRCNCVSLD